MVSFLFGETDNPHRGFLFENAMGFPIPAHVLYSTVGSASGAHILALCSALNLHRKRWSHQVQSPKKPIRWRPANKVNQTRCQSCSLCTVLRLWWSGSSDRLIPWRRGSPEVSQFKSRSLLILSAGWRYSSPVTPSNHHFRFKAFITLYSYVGDDSTRGRPIKAPPIIKFRIRATRHHNSADR